MNEANEPRDDVAIDKLDQRYASLRLASPEELSRVRAADGTYARLLFRFARTDVLVIDDWALAPLTGRDISRTCSSLTISSCSP
jgi:hypothetical protein